MRHLMVVNVHKRRTRGKYILFLAGAALLAMLMPLNAYSTYNHVHTARNTSILSVLSIIYSDSTYWFLVAVYAWLFVHVRNSDVWVCAMCDYEIGDERGAVVGDEPWVCPECGADLRPAGATAQGHIMSSKGRTRLYSFVFTMWALSTAYWLYQIL